MADPERARRIASYEEELPAEYEKAKLLLKGYSRIPDDEIEAHVRAIREKAWKVFPYGCIGRWRFLDLYITTLPIYADVVKRVQGGDIFLDAGCAFGYVLRQLAFDGAPAANLVGADLRQEFIDLGYELFRDRDTFGGRFVVGDMLKAADDKEAAALTALDGKVDIIHAASFFHLFSYRDQVRLGERLVRFFRPDAKDAVLFGRQVGNPNPDNPATHEEFGPGRYFHNQETLQEMWDEIGKRTDTKWAVQATLEEVKRNADTKRHSLKFEIRKASPKGRLSSLIDKVSRR